MEHTRHARANTLLRLAVLAPLVFEHCASYPSVRDYDFHYRASAEIAKVRYPATLHLRRHGETFEGYYIIDLPDYRLRRTFVATPTYYPINEIYEGESGTSISVSFKDEIRGRIAWFEASRLLNSSIIYDQFRHDTIPHFTGIRLQVPDTGEVVTTVPYR